ncbi:hypothetical protein EJ06DRAFT_562648 [Trichodelitschia bisporula]|uniref:Septin-type G domain-containing protein n=1 Tax=Trichodelitschia bisporula TaxID=703511 RepID=A0A6G1HUI0_9PEZI|nr:hypothetical protein EJ06DRAFT_562648 [Trichodelitschia bisporula]
MGEEHEDEKKRRRADGNPTAEERVEGTGHTGPAYGVGSVHTTHAFSQQRRPSRANTISRPLTPLQLASPGPESVVPSTPKSGSFRSLRLSDGEEADAASQAIESSDEEDVAPPHFGLRGNAPELVMPSLAMPTRRPFTERGRLMGRVKVCVLTDAGSGKTSFIRALVQSCEDIVHLDPISTSGPTFHASPASKKTRRKRGTETAQITEIYASTRAYPGWWSDLEESRILRRRKSMGDTVLERNVCFIDTPGCNYTHSTSDGPDPVVRYLEELLHKNASISTMQDSELLGLLTGDGGVQVDVVLYVFSHKMSCLQDIDYFKRLSELTNVIPVIGKADLLSPQAMADLKTSILNQLHTYSARPFLFGKSAEDIMQVTATTLPASAPSQSPASEAVATSPPPPEHRPTSTEPPSYSDILPPFAISTLHGSDDLEMDASLLMSSTYTPPLMGSDLSHFVELLLDPSTIAWLRHTAARKFLTWRSRKPSSLDSSTAGPRSNRLVTRGSSMSLGSPTLNTGHGLASPMTDSPALFTSHTMMERISPFNLSSSAHLSDFTRASLRDHAAQEERLAQMQLARWAAEVQRALRAERERFEMVAKGERARWLLERIGEEVKAGGVGVVEGGKLELPRWASKKEKKVAKGRGKRVFDPADPLGLLEWGDGARRAVGVVVRVLEGGVVVGAVWWAVARILGWDQERGGWLPVWW